MVTGSHTCGEIPAGDFYNGDLAATRSAIEQRAGGTWQANNKWQADKKWREQPMLLPAGAASLHHRHTVHGSRANTIDRPRLGLAIHLRTQDATPIPGADDWFIQNLEGPVKAPVVFG